MKRKITALCLMFALIFTPGVLAAPSVSAPSAVLISADSGLLLYAKNEHARMYPASTTKIMTAILALENGNFDDAVTVSHDAVFSISYDSSKAGLYEGEIVSCDLYEHNTLKCYVCLNFMINITPATNQRIL